MDSVFMCFEVVHAKSDFVGIVQDAKLTTVDFGTKDEPSLGEERTVHELRTWEEEVGQLGLDGKGNVGRAQEDVVRLVLSTKIGTTTVCKDNVWVVVHSRLKR